MLAEAEAPPSKRPGPRVVWPLLVGGIGTLLVLIGASQRSSPFAEHAAGSWFFSIGLGGGGLGLESGLLLLYAGLALLGGAWVSLLLASREGLGLTQLRIGLVFWGAPLLLVAPLFSRDAYSYVAQGEMVSRGFSPYRHGASVLGTGALSSHVDPIWRHAVAPYGPAWERSVQGLLAAAGHSLLGTLVLLRLSSAASLAVLAWGIPRLASRGGFDPSAAFVFSVMNPLVLLTLLGGMHNDGEMLALVVAGVAVAQRGHFVSGTLLCLLGAEVKAPALLAVVFIACWAGLGRPGRVRIAYLAAYGIASAAALWLIDLSTGLGSAWVKAALTPGKVVSWLDPATALGLGLSRLSSVLGLGAHRASLLAGVRGGALAGAALFSVILAWRSRPDRGPGDLGSGFLAFALLGPVVWPWYESWGIALMGTRGLRPGRRRVGFLLGLSLLGSIADFAPGGDYAAGPTWLTAAGWGALGLGLGLFVLIRVRDPGGARSSRGSSPRLRGSDRSSRRRSSG